MKYLAYPLLAACALASSTAVAAGGYPSRPIRIVVDFPAGGTIDSLARVVGQQLGDRWGQPVVVENRPGAGGNIGAQEVYAAAPDGYTLLATPPGPLSINEYLYKDLAFKPSAFAAVGLLAGSPNTITVKSSLPVQSVQELIVYAKANPGKLSYASSGNGASSHLAGVLFNSVAGTDLQHIPYKGTGPALNDLLGNQVSMTFTDILTALPYVKAGKLRALGVATSARSQALPDVPTIAEQGYKGYDVSVFFGIVAPAGTPADRVAKLNHAFAEVLNSPKVKQMFTAQGLEASADTSPQKLGQFIAAESVKWKDVVQKSGAQLD